MQVGVEHNGEKQSNSINCAANLKKCRCCLSIGSHQHIFGMAEIEMLEDLNITVTGDSRFPAALCSPCHILIKTVKQFRDQVIVSEAALKQAFNEQIKCEIDRVHLENDPLEMCDVKTEQDCESSLCSDDIASDDATEKMTSRSDRIMALARKTAASNITSEHQVLPATDFVSTSCTSDSSVAKCSKVINERFNDLFLKCNETLASCDEEKENTQINNKLTLRDDSDDSVKDKGYIPGPISDSTDTYCEDLLISRVTTSLPEEGTTAIIETSNSNNNINGPVLEHNSSQGTCESPVNLNNSEQFNLINNPVEKEKGLTKSGLPRKRQVFVESLKERKKIKKQLLVEKLSLKRACMENCRRKCSTNINEDQRKIINNYYSELSKESQGVFIKGTVETKAVERRKQTSREIAFVVSEIS